MIEEITQEDKILYCCAIANLLNEDEIVTKEEIMFLNKIVSDLQLNLRNKEIKLRINQAMKSKFNLKPYAMKLKSKALKIMLFRTMLSILGKKKYFLPIDKNNIIDAVKVMRLNDKICKDIIKLSVEMYSQEDKFINLLLCL